MLCSVHLNGSPLYCILLLHIISPKAIINHRVKKNNKQINNCFHTKSLMYLAASVPMAPKF